MDNEILREREAAKVLSIAVGTLRNWHYKGKGPVRYKQGQKLTYYLLSDLLAWIRDGKDNRVEVK